MGFSGIFYFGPVRGTSAGSYRFGVLQPVWTGLAYFGRFILIRLLFGIVVESATSVSSFGRDQVRVRLVVQDFRRTGGVPTCS